MVFEDVLYCLLYLQNISSALKFTAILTFFMTALDCSHLLHSDLPNSGICLIIFTTQPDSLRLLNVGSFLHGADSGLNNQSQYNLILVT